MYMFYLLQKNCNKRTTHVHGGVSEVLSKTTLLYLLDPSLTLIVDSKKYLKNTKKINPHSTKKVHNKNTKHLNSQCWDKKH